MLALTDSHLSMVTEALNQQAAALFIFKPVGGHGIIGPVAGAISVMVMVYIADQVTRGNLAVGWYLAPIIIGWISVFSASATAGGQAPGAWIFKGMLGVADGFTLDFVQAVDKSVSSGFFVAGTDKITDAALPWRNLAEKEFSAELSSSAASGVRVFASQCVTDSLIADLEAGSDGKTILEATPIRIGGVPTDCYDYMTRKKPASTTDGVDATLAAWQTGAGITNFGGLRATGKELLPALKDYEHEVGLAASGNAADQLAVRRTEQLLSVSAESFGEYIGGWTWLMALFYFVWLIFLFTPWVFPATGIYFALLLAGRAQIWGFYAIHSYDTAAKLADPTQTVTVLNALRLYGLRLPGDLLDKHRAYEARHLSALAFEEKAIVAVPVLVVLLLTLMFVVPRLRRAR